MRKHTITALAAALCLLCTGVPFTGIPETTSLSASAADAEKLTSGILTYTVENDEIIITGCEDTDGAVEIPAEIDGMPVTHIGSTAFYGNSLSAITIPDSMVTIGAGAFWHCANLSKVVIPSSVTAVESYAFNDCAALESITIPKGLTAIGQDAFGATPWMTAQQEKDPFVVVNGVLIDASAVVNKILAETEAEKERAAEEGAVIKAWREPGKRTNVITNQVGYFTKLAKKATYVTDATKAVAFDLLDASGKVAYSGKTTPYGLDNASGDNVHIIDFTEFEKEGTYTIRTADGETSRAFKIGVTDSYSGLMYDALNYFYQNRSGVPIESEYITSGDVEALARDAGHAPDMANIQLVFNYEGPEGTQDVTGGWYDAGDHGKYVVNGGITLWLLQNMYERAQIKGTTAGLDDGSMKIPENGNNLPDLLDETRFEMEWMLKMIVQDGDSKGMVHHKVHDAKWTAIGTDPSKDKVERYLLPPSTAATLNLAACGAQAYRLWKDLDPDFADECLTAAKNAYAAAKANPAVYAPNKEHGGGGAYSDSNVTDEFYWAACELFTTTGDESYYEDIKAYDGAFTIMPAMGDTADGGLCGVFDWGYTAPLGSLTLLLHPDTVSKDEIGQVRTSLLSTADAYVELSNSEGYGIPYQGYVGKNGYQTYVWGSNSFVADDAIVMAYAYDEAEDAKYLNGVVSAMDYILGRNALDFSYVTGYGEHSIQYPHHRWWAKSAKKEFPKAPCGVLSGGPNANFDDPIIKMTDCVKGETPTQLCYTDNIEAYSVNECAINWNSPLVWVTGFLCEQNGGIVKGQASAGTQLIEPVDPLDIELPEIEIVIPDGITAVGEQIFGKSTSRVKSVVIPDSVTSIGKNAFAKCSILENITIPETIESVGDSAFAGTPWLKAKLAESPLLIINGIVIDGTACTDEVVIPDGVTRILGNAFKLNDKITAVSIPEGVTEIGPEAFSNCTALAELNLPDTLTTIGKNAFSGAAISELVIPASVKSIGVEAFSNCTNLPEVTVLNKDMTIGTEALGCTVTFTATGQYSYVFTHLVDEDFIVRCEKGSKAEQYALATGLKVAYLDGEEVPTSGGVKVTLYGDADENGKVNILDVIAVNKCVMIGEPLSAQGKANADVDGSDPTKPDAKDALNILKKVVGLIELPVKNTK